MSDAVPIRKLPSGVPGLDEVLGGGIVVGQALKGHQGLLTGTPATRAERQRP